MSYEYLWILVSTCILGLWCNLVYQSLLSIQLLLGSLATVCISCPCIAAVSKCANMLPTNTIDLHDHHLDPGMGRSPEVDDQLKQSQLSIMHRCGKTNCSPPRGGPPGTGGGGVRGLALVLGITAFRKVFIKSSARKTGPLEPNDAVNFESSTLS